VILNLCNRQLSQLSADSGKKCRRQGKNSGIRKISGATGSDKIIIKLGQNNKIGSRVVVIIFICRMIISLFVCYLSFTVLSIFTILLPLCAPLFIIICQRVHDGDTLSSVPHSFFFLCARFCALRARSAIHLPRHPSIARNIIRIFHVPFDA
jgi:hypothetical protein